MEEIKQYILTIVCVAILCGIIQLSFSGKNSICRAVKLISGLVLTVTVISPLIHMDRLTPASFINSISIDGQWAVAEGKQVAEDRLAVCIKDKAESYILEKANGWGLNILAEVMLSDDTPPIPEQVTITGVVSPYGKRQLMHCIEEELGIAEENQLWIS